MCHSISLKLKNSSSSSSFGSIPATLVPSPSVKHSIRSNRRCESKSGFYYRFGRVRRCYILFTDLYASLLIPKRRCSSPTVPTRSPSAGNDLLARPGRYSHYGVTGRPTTFSNRTFPGNRPTDRNDFGVRRRQTAVYKLITRTVTVSNRFAWKTRYAPTLDANKSVCQISIRRQTRVLIVFADQSKDFTTRDGRRTPACDSVPRVIRASMFDGPVEKRVAFSCTKLHTLGCRKFVFSTSRYSPAKRHSKATLVGLL